MHTVFWRCFVMAVLLVQTRFIWFIYLYLSGSIRMNACDLFNCILDVYFSGIGEIVRLPPYQRIDPDLLQWRHNGHDSVSKHQPYDCLLYLFFRHRSKKTSKLRVTGLCVGNWPGTGEFPAQMASNAKNVSTWWRHHKMRAKSTGAKPRITHPASERRRYVVMPSITGWAHAQNDSKWKPR